MFINILVLIVIFLIAIAQYTLDYVWSDRRTKRYKRIRFLLLSLMILFLVGSGWIQIGENRNADKLSKDVAILQSKNDSLILIVRMLHTNIVTMENKISDLEFKLDPFIEIAMMKYPDLAIANALQKLAIEIAEVKKMAKPNTLSYSEVDITKIDKGYRIQISFKPQKDEPVGQIKLNIYLEANAKALLLDVSTSGIAVDVSRRISSDRKSSTLEFSPMGGKIPAVTISVSDKTAITIEGNRGLGIKTIDVQ